MWAQLLTRRVAKQTKKKMSRNAKGAPELGRIEHHEMVSILLWATFRGVNNHYLFLHFLRTKLVVSLVPIIIWIKIRFGSKPANSKFIIGLEYRHLWRHLETMKTNLFQKDRKWIIVSDTDMATVPWAFDTLTLFTQISFSKTHYIRRISAESIWHNGMLIKRKTLCLKLLMKWNFI